MDLPPAIAVVIPALNEEEAIGKVLRDIPDIAQQVVVVDNGSSDGTAAVARSLGARVVVEPRRGYGQACLSGIAHLSDADIVVFLDGDYSDYPEELTFLVAPLIADTAPSRRALGSTTRLADPTRRIAAPRRERRAQP